MNKNIDLTKILKNCPAGTKLYSPIYGEIYFEEIRSNDRYPISTITKSNYTATFTKEGFHYADEDGECVLFPSKEQRDWNKFTAPWYNKPIEQKFQVGQYITDGHDSGQIIEVDCHCYKILDFTGNTNIIIPFTLQDNYHLWTIQDAKYGDVLALSWMEDENLFEKIVIFKKYHSEGIVLYNVPCVEGYGNTFKNGKIAFTDEKIPYYSKSWTCNLQPATKEQRDRLFQRIKEAGYKWNVETKTLEEKFDPKTLKPFDKILVRDSCIENWYAAFFSHIAYDLSEYDLDDCEKKLDFIICTTGSADFSYCIPFNDETKHLVGTKAEVPKFYRYWED